MKRKHIWILGILFLSIILFYFFVMYFFVNCNGPYEHIYSYRKDEYCCLGLYTVTSKSEQGEDETECMLPGYFDPIKDEWKSCEYDSDCSSIRTSCCNGESPIAINKYGKEAIENWKLLNCMFVVCPFVQYTAAVSLPSKSICLNKTCFIKYQYLTTAYHSSCITNDTEPCNINWDSSYVLNSSANYSITIPDILELGKRCHSSCCETFDCQVANSLIFNDSGSLKLEIFDSKNNLIYSDTCYYPRKGVCQMKEINFETVYNLKRYTTLLSLNYSNGTLVKGAYVSLAISGFVDL